MGSDERITIVETLDERALTESVKASVGKFYPGARLAHLKQGGSFPFLSNPDEFNMHLLVHLRRVSLSASVVSGDSSHSQ